MKKLITILFLFFTVITFAQRATTVGVVGGGGDGYVQTLSVNVDTLFSTGVGSAFNGYVILPSGGGSTDYVSNVALSNNSLNFTGVGNAFSSSVGNVANTTYGNTFTQTNLFPRIDFGTSNAYIYNLNDSLMFADGSNASGVSLNRLLQLGESGSGDGYISAVSFNTGDGVLTLTQPIAGNKTVDLDGRFLLSSSYQNNYISNVSGTGNTITFTGVGNAFNGTLTAVARTNQTNNFTVSQRFQGNIQIENASFQDRGFIEAGTSGLYLDAASGYGTYLQVNSGTKLWVDANGTYANLDAATTSDVVYFNSSTKEFTYGTAPTGGTPNYGADQQIPFMNGTTAFDYSSDLYWNGLSLVTTNISLSGLAGLLDYGSLPSNPSTGLAYFLNDGGDPMWITSAGQQNLVTTTGATSGRVAYWNGQRSVTSDADFTFNGIDLRVGAADGTGTVNSGNFVLTSDKRLKSNIRRESDWSWIDGINIYSYRMKGAPEFLRYGVIAQEIEAINPDLVRKDKDGIYSVAYIDYLIAKSARQDERIQKLEDKLYWLTKRVEDLENEK